MKIQIEISNETLQTIMDGKRVEGALRLMPSEGKKKPVISFNAYNRKPYKRPKENVLFYLEHGRVTESPERIKMYESVPKRLGLAYVGKVMVREAKTAAEELNSKP
ncbi:MAG: hypothetical protein J5616_03360 [Bacteroidaceae bacterium]|nr:hypothetical protein [Bacteroidaceae bacterium]